MSTDNSTLIRFRFNPSDGRNDKELCVSPLFRRAGFFRVDGKESSDLLLDLYKAAKAAITICGDCPEMVAQKILIENNREELNYGEIEDGCEVRQEAEGLLSIPSPLLPHELFVPRWMPQVFWAAESEFRSGDSAFFDIALSDYGAVGISRTVNPWQRWCLSKSLRELGASEAIFDPGEESLYLYCDFFSHHWCGFERYLCLAMYEIVLSLVRMTHAVSATGYLLVDGDLYSGPKFQFVGERQFWCGDEQYSPWHRHLRPPARHPEKRLDEELDVYESWLLTKFPMELLASPGFPGGERLNPAGWK